MNTAYWRRTMLYPVSSETRGMIDLNGIWKFKVDFGHGFDEKWYELPLKDTMEIIVPSSYNDLTVTRELQDHNGWVWYEKDFTIPYYMLNERLMLRFGAAAHYAKIYINGKHVTEHKGGFLPFEVQMNDYLRRGKNRVTVAINNIMDNQIFPLALQTVPDAEKDTLKKLSDIDFYHYSGLHRPVRIYTTPRTYIKDISLVTDFEGDTGILNCSVDVIGEHEYVRISIFDENNYQKAITEGSNKQLLIRDVELWEPLDPYLYQLKVEVLNDDQVVDVYEMPFGVRTVDVKDGQFFINRKPFYFKGFGKYDNSDFSVQGANEPVNIIDFNLMKGLGANSFRTSQYPYSEELMRLADRVGFLVINETFAVEEYYNILLDNLGQTPVWEELELYQHHQNTIKDYIARDKNHPSVVMWSVANQLSENIEASEKYFKPLVDLAKKSDPQQRPVTILMSEQVEPEVDYISELVDVISINRSYGWKENPGNLEKAAKDLSSELTEWEHRYPEKPILMTEYGPDPSDKEAEITDEMLTDDFQIKFLDTYHEIFDQHKMFAGEYIWNFADFAQVKDSKSMKGSTKGIFTRSRKPKATAIALKKRWENIPDFNYKK